MLHIGNIPIRRDGPVLVRGVIALPWEGVAGYTFPYYMYTILVDGHLFYLLYIPGDVNRWAIHVPTGHIVDIRDLLLEGQHA